MAAEDWLDAARAELDELNAEVSLSGADAWRALALTSRLVAAGSHALPGDRLAELLATVEPAPAVDLIDELAEALAEPRHEPGELLLLLLDVDDRVGIETLRTNSDVGAGLASRAAALVSLYPTQIQELSDFAAMRLQCFTGAHPTQALWRAVADAAVHRLTEALPATLQAEPSPALVARLAASRTAGVWAPVVLEGGRRVRWVGQLDRRLLRAAAATTETGSSPVHDAGGRVVGWVYPSPESGRPTLELRLDAPPSSDVRVALVITDAAGTPRASLDIEVEVDGAEVYADLSGVEPGSTGLFAELLAESGLPPEDVHLRVGVHD